MSHLKILSQISGSHRGSSDEEATPKASLEQQ